MKNTDRPTRLRPFTQWDWNAFSGCDSATPMIAEGPFWTLVLDGRGVEFLTQPDGDDGPTWNGMFPDEETARRVAYAILASPTRGVVTSLLEPWEGGVEDDGSISF
jgi:hypothetical protein